MSGAKEVVLDYLPHQNFHWENFHPDVKALSGEKTLVQAIVPSMWNFVGKPYTFQPIPLCSRHSKRLTCR